MKKTILTRVESWVNLGIPDCIVALDNRLFLVELKVVKKGNKVAIRPHQVAFHTMHGLYPCFILVEVGAGRAKELKLYHARQVIDLAENGVKLTPAGVFPSSDWQGVESFLSSW